MTAAVPDPRRCDQLANPVDALLREVVQALWDTERAQVVIAADLGISQKHLSMIRQCRAEPSLLLLRDMCRVLGVDARVLAAANQRTVEELRAAADELIRLGVGSGYNGWYASWLRARAAVLDPICPRCASPYPGACDRSACPRRAAALASPAPAPRAEGSTDTRPAPAHAHGAAQGADDGV